jgi:predicted DNA-binding protein (MmcQ/YjbR family)
MMKAIETVYLDEIEIEIEKIRNLIKIKHTLVRASFTKRELKRLEI